MELRTQDANFSANSLELGGLHLGPVEVSYDHGTAIFSANSHRRPGPIPFTRRDVDPAELYPEYNISVPVDHFHNESMYEPHSDGMFPLRYYFDASHYRKGGPVIVLQGGETGVDTRLPYLQKGIVAILAEATGGIGVILEHRYYGTSFPTDNLTTESLRFLTTEQALADQAYFAQNIVFPGMEDQNLTSSGGTPYIAYGGSYAGAFVAFLRIQYPDIYWGAISSSGVTEAIWDYWEYYEPIREYGPPECIDAHTKIVNVMDNIFKSGDNQTIDELKSAFNASSLTYNDDLAYIVTENLAYWQERNWDPAVNYPTFYQYCGNITNDTVLFPETASLTSNVSALIQAGGWSNETDYLTNRMLNFIGWNVANIIDACEGETLDECYNTHNASATMYTDKSVYNYNDLSWNYQICTEWGFFQTGSGVPQDRLPLVSRLIDIPYSMLVCNLAFNISTASPDVERANKYGGFNVSYPRLALVGGQTDPWRPASPLATLGVPTRLNSSSTVSQPIILIEGAVHHWDENGLFPNETTAQLPPQPVANAQAEEVQYVQAWLQEYQQTRRMR